jgi:YspA, cpYpsA-related SLOG family
VRVLVCGSRTWAETTTPIIASVLTGLYEEHYPFSDPFVVIEGEARGADTYAHNWAEWYDGHVSGDGGPVELEPYPADWATHGKAAGPIRNQKMLTEGRPDLVVAFSDDIEHSRGTKDMLVRAKKAGIPAILVARP